MRHLQLKKYLDLPQKGKVMAEYVWIDGSNGIRSKSKVSIFNPAFHTQPAAGNTSARSRTGLLAAILGPKAGGQMGAICTTIHILEVHEQLASANMSVVLYDLMHANRTCFCSLSGWWLEMLIGSGPADAPPSTPPNTTHAMSAY
jgi:hypothetical protein